MSKEESAVSQGVSGVSAGKSVKLKPVDVEKRVVELAREGVSPERIGLILRDQFGVPSFRVVTGKSIKQVLSAEGLWKDPETVHLQFKLDGLKKHFSSHLHDWAAQRSITKNSSKMKKLGVSS